MMYDAQITLIEQQDTTDEYGDTISTQAGRQVFVETMSIGQSEFYQANEQGLKPQMKFKLADCEDYNNEKRVICEGVIYRVLRTYKTQRNELEITVYGGVKDANAKVCNTIE